ncbi:MAG: NAD(P)H-binding protein [Myxococcota bacterium]
MAHTGQHNVVGFARTPAKAAHLGIEIRPGDYLDTEGLTRSFADIEVVLLVSGNAQPDQRIPQHRSVIAAAKAASVRKIVYTSVQGPDANTSFSPIIQSNRQTETDIRNSGLAWSIGRNGIYIEPDLEYIAHYRKTSTIANCAGDGPCGYTTRDELATAYTQMLIDAQHDGQTYNLHGMPLTQTQLAELFNTHFKTDLQFQDMTPEAYLAERTEALGDHLGPIITGIYEGIRNGAYNNPSHFEQMMGRPHADWDEVFRKAAAAEHG